MSRVRRLRYGVADSIAARAGTRVSPTVSLGTGPPGSVLSVWGGWRQVNVRIDERGSAPAVSVVIPVFNEEECIDPLLDELFPVVESLPPASSGIPHEVIVVDDGSTDRTPQLLRRRAELFPQLRVLTLYPNAGQSAAFEAGFRAARGDVFVTLDGDGQNDPADIPKVLACLAGEVAVFGVRVRRADPQVRKIAQRVANGVRNFVLGSSYRDVGCSLKAFRREVIVDRSLYNGLHRFFPYLIEMKGRRGVEIEVSHRPRERGTSKYRAFGRGWPAFWDLWMVRRMMQRALRYSVVEQEVARDRAASSSKGSA